jgi:hypothetical protein
VQIVIAGSRAESLGDHIVIEVLSNSKMPFYDFAQQVTI